MNDSNSVATRYYSLARYALLDALRLVGIGPGQRVLLPSYICRDLLAPLTLLNAHAVWYDVSPQLAPICSPDDWPTADAVLAVNYFGFAQNLAPFISYAARTGATLIEDNAHGYLSRDEDGHWLGTRAGLGILSLRKTLPLADGAALLVNDARWLDKLPAQIPFDGRGLNPAQVLKARMHKVPFVGKQLLRGATGLTRLLRQWRKAHTGAPSEPDSERTLTANAHPWIGLPRALAHCQVTQEITRRRASYADCAQEGARVGVEPVFASLPTHCAPYAYAFRGTAAGIDAMHRWAQRRGFDIVTWPDLPSALEKTSPLYYRNVFLINLLW